MACVPKNETRSGINSFTNVNVQIPWLLIFLYRIVGKLLLAIGVSRTLSFSRQPEPNRSKGLPLFRSFFSWLPGFPATLFLSDGLRFFSKTYHNYIYWVGYWREMLLPQYTVSPWVLLCFTLPARANKLENNFVFTVSAYFAQNIVSLPIPDSII